MFYAVILCCFILPVTGSFCSDFSNEDCMECHSDSTLTKMSEKGVEVPLYVDLSKFSASLHGEFQCTECHASITELPHEEELKKPDCGLCHEDVTEVYLKSYHGHALAEGDLDAPCCWCCHSKHYIYPKDDSLSTINPLNQPKTCARCHSDPTLVEKHRIPIPDPSEAYQKSIHYKRIREEEIISSATCSDCHGAHDLQPATHPGSMINRMNVPKTCSKCHEEIYKVYMESVHGQGLLAGASESPVCTDCHSEHSIKEHTDPTSTVFTTVVSKRTCAHCHEAEQIISKYGLTEAPVNSYNDSYHGLAVRGGSTVAANCASCHGVHDIRPSSDPKSSIHKDNLMKTCAKCHPGISANVAVGKVHIKPTSESDRLIYYISKIYIILIFVVIGGMLLHNGLDFLKKARAKYKNIHSHSDTKVSANEFVRLNLNERVQHVLLMVSFFILVFTGFALKYPESWWAAPLVRWEGAFAFRGLLHRIAGAVMIALSFYHLFYIGITRRGRRHLIDLFPRWKDVSDVIQMVKYYIGLAKDKPRFARYNYMEKAEYWALVWGTIVMSVTGVILWYENLAMKFFPKWVSDVSTVIHLYEAILATLAIIVWHFYFQFLDPHVYPMNFTCITGKISEEDMKEEHPLEYEKLTDTSKG